MTSTLLFPNCSRITTRQSLYLFHKQKQVDKDCKPNDTNLDIDYIIYNNDKDTRLGRSSLYLCRFQNDQYPMEPINCRLYIARTPDYNVAVIKIHQLKENSTLYSVIRAVLAKSIKPATSKPIITT